MSLFFLAAIALVSALLFNFCFDRNPDDLGIESHSSLGSGLFFDKIADYYDITNKFMSLGLDDSWRRALVESMAIELRDDILDIATGTGEVAIRMLKSKRMTKVINALDPSRNMLGLAQKKVDEMNFTSSVQFVHGDVESMDMFESSSFNKVTMSFGIRNVPNRTQALIEIFRVMRSDGVLGIMEFTAPERGPLAPVVTYFISYIVPLVGSMSSGGKTTEYKHLSDSIFAFPTAQRFTEEITAVGFRSCSVKNVFFHTVLLHLCKK